MEWLAAFRHPSMLALLVVPAALLLWTWKRAGRAVVLPLDDSKIQHSRMTQFFLRCAESLPALALAVVIVILAGPQRWDVPRSKRALTNIEFCVDVSGSMNAQFGSGDRYTGAMDAINKFVDARKGDAFGLTFFGNNVLHWVPLTTDPSAVKCAPPFMHPRQLPYWFGGTEIGKALRACRKVLVEREEGDRMIVLVTDGYSSDLSGGADEEIARELIRDGITCYAINIGDSQAPDEIVRITSMTGGEAFNPDDPRGLEHVFASIDKMQRTRLEKTTAEASDDFLPWTLAGLALLLLLLLAYLGLRYTPW